MQRLIDRARELGQLKRGQKDAVPPHLSYVMELAYLCRLRGSPVTKSLCVTFIRRCIS